MEVKTDGVRWGFAGLAALVVLSKRRLLSFSAETSAALMSESLVDVVLFRTVGLVLAPVEARRFTGAGSVLRRSVFGFSALDVEGDVLLFLFALPSLTVCVALAC